MKEDNIFDKIESNFENISDETIIVDTGINPDNVRRMVMEEIKTKKRKFSKKIVIGLIAATLSIGVLTTGVVASGSFNSTFAEWFSGDCEIGLYSGGNVNAMSSSDDFDVNVLGVAGDDDEAYIAIEIKRKDGKSFYTNDNRIFSFENYNIDVTMPWFAHDSGGSRGYECFFKDDKTIQMNVCFERSGTLKGQRFTGKFDTFKFQEYECIKECKTLDIDECDKEIEKLNEEYKDRLTDGAYIFPLYTKEDDWQYCIIKETTYDVCFDISLDLNYKSSTKECSIENDSAKSNMGKFTISSARASAMSVRIVSNNHKEYANSEGLDEILGGKVHMKNGDVYDIKINGSQQSSTGYPDGTSHSETTITGMYTKDGNRIVINPEDIEKIEMGGAVVTFD